MIEEVVGGDVARDGLIAVTDRRLVFLSTPLWQSLPIWVDVPLYMIESIELMGPATGWKGHRVRVELVGSGRVRPIALHTMGGGLTVAQRLVAAVQSAIESCSSERGVVDIETRLQMCLTDAAVHLIRARGGSVWVARDVDEWFIAETRQPDDQPYVEHDDAHPVTVYVSEDLLWFSAIDVRRGRSLFGQATLKAKLAPAPF